MIKRPALRYFGGKWKLADWIIQQFPPHICYCEPFGGGASVLLRKAPAFINVYNDKNDLVVNFFQMLRDHPQELIQAIALTPYSRQEYLNAQELSNDPLESARCFYTWCWQGRGRGGIKEKGGWRFMRSDSRCQTPVDDWNKIEYLFVVAQKFRQVQIEKDDALKVIRRYDTPDTLFYIDPPYVHDSRGARWSRSAYYYDMSDDQHRELADLLKSLVGKVVVSGYQSNLYDELYSGWRSEIRKAYKDQNQPVHEVLWMNFSDVKRLF